MQIDLQGFLEDKAQKFVTELWTLLISAQKEANGIPKELIEEKKEEQKRKLKEIQEAKEKLLKIQQLTMAAQRGTSRDSH